MQTLQSVLKEIRLVLVGLSLVLEESNDRESVELYTRRCRDMLMDISEDIARNLPNPLTNRPLTI